jgi:endonuclease/exonuclease/phosphatase family metal-dependent hydrolase
MQGNRIRIASYNIRKARGLDQLRKPGRILDIINGLDADIILLQEADRRLGQRQPALPRELIEEASDYELVELSANGVSIGWHGNAVLVRKSFAPNHIERLYLPGLEPRGAVRMSFDILGGFTVVGTHLGLRRRDRLAQLAALNLATAQDRNVVIAGDFNEWSASKGFEPFEGRFKTHSPGLSFHARRPVAALDRFALTCDIQLYDAGVEQGNLARVASDHLPIWSDLLL